MNLPDFLTRGSMGEIRLTGHRIDLYLIVWSYRDGFTAEMIHEDYPTLPLPLIYKVLAFYLENQSEVDAYVAEVEAVIERRQAEYIPGPGVLRIRQLVAERAARAASLSVDAGVLSMTLPDFLTCHEKGEIRLSGHRIDLFHLVSYYNDGYSAEMLLGQFPTLNLALIHKVIAFYLENKADVDAYVARCEAEIERYRAATPPAPTLEELRARKHARNPAAST
jgi:uncharacterized protein (DUF433 family)